MLPAESHLRCLFVFCVCCCWQFRIQDLTGTFFGKTNGPVRVNPISLYRWTEM